MLHTDGEAWAWDGPHLQGHLPDEELPLIVLVVAADSLTPGPGGKASAWAQAHLAKALR